MAQLKQSKEFEDSIREAVRVVGSNMDTLSDALSHASKACSAFAANYEALKQAQEFSPDKQISGTQGINRD